jgi:futalosine hydrolase
MAILLCAATELEIRETKNWIRKYEPEVQVLITGVGMMACTYHLTNFIRNNNFDFILQGGVGGSLEKDLQMGAVVQVSSECIGDMGVEETTGFTDVFTMKLADPNEYPWKNGKLLNPYVHPALHSVDGVTINEITTRQERMDWYRDNTKAAVESMEGAALHFVALNEGIPFLQIRSISNFAGERDKTRWQMKEALANLNAALKDLLPQLLHHDA